LKFPKLGLPDFGGPQLLLQTFDQDKIKSEVVALVKIFPMICGTPPAHKEFRAIPDF
jgi:hypothetical protein